MSKSHTHTRMHMHYGIFVQNQDSAQRKSHPLPRSVFQQSKIVTIFFLQYILCCYHTFFKSLFIIYNLRSTPGTGNMTIYNNRQRKANETCFCVGTRRYIHVCVLVCALNKTFKYYLTITL